MKKTFLLLMAMFMTMTCAKAVDWQPVDTNIPNLNLYIDKDSITNVNATECIYAIRFQSGTKPEQVAYLKSNLSTNHIGVINASDYDENLYKPKIVFYNAHVFMKPINGDSFLNFANNYAIKTLAEKTLAKAQTKTQKNAFTPEKPQADLVLREKALPNTDITNTDYEIKLIPQKETKATDLKSYVAEAAELINANWTPPKSGRKTQAILIVQIGPDGSLRNYKFAKSSGDKVTDRSILSAVEKTVPFADYSKITGNTTTLKFQFVFDYKYFKKSVM
mgnify:CR=1 FL=1